MKNLLRLKIIWSLVAMFLLFVKSAFNPVQAQILAGNVFNDGNGLNDPGGPLVNTSGTNASIPLDGVTTLGTQLYVTLVNTSGVAVATTTVGSTGTYTFGAVSPGSYTAVLSTNVAGSVSPNSPLPAGWAFTGEQIGATPGNTDGTVDGVVAGIEFVDSDIVDVNFGLNSRPTTTPGLDVQIYNPGGNNAVGLTGAMFIAADREDVFVPGLSGETVRLQPAEGGDLYYDGVLVSPDALPITNFNASLVTVDPDGTNNQLMITVTFSYTVFDEAGWESLPANIQVPFIANPLPVTLISFSATRQERTNALVEWTTAEEVNTDRFEIEHSSDAKIWRVVGSVKAAGESSVRKNYSFLDAVSGLGKNFYRLKMIDLDETFAYSKIQSIDMEEFRKEISVYPNPTSDILYIQGINTNELAGAIIRNAAGQIVMTSGKASDRIVLRDLSSGIYTLQITDRHSVSSTHKVIIGK